VYVCEYLMFVLFELLEIVQAIIRVGIPIIFITFLQARYFK